MQVAAIIATALIVAGLLLWLLDRRALRRAAAPAERKEKPERSSSRAAGAGQEEVCCGQHYSCEKDSLLTAVATGIEYYEDEELDRYAGRRPDEYSEPEKDEFRDVMLTLLPSELAGWGRSIQLRGISLPSDVRDEFLLLINDLRAAKS